MARKMASSSDEEHVILDSSANKWFLLKQISARECHVHPVNHERKVFGEHRHLYQKLRNYPERFFQYSRMDVKTFDYIKARVSPKLQKNWRNVHAGQKSANARARVGRSPLTAM
ncbi:hypothetical protein J437_LFUL000356 [Ladona fulva]|uniref:Uncharacterized protein n=1 Tax=Ladona fulva TaxID=123851 RepID=A0A8K0NSM3_LADFU|nr:hypothetical protein J437_LFUL000356 [Ladona fulva]